jgi:hypothetical protein
MKWVLLRSTKSINIWNGVKFLMNVPEFDERTAKKLNDPAQ